MHKCTGSEGNSYIFFCFRVFASVDFADYICDTDCCWWCSHRSTVILLLQGGEYIVMEILYSI